MEISPSLTVWLVAFLVLGIVIFVATLVQIVQQTKIVILLMESNSNNETALELLQELNTATTKVGERIEKLVTKLENGGMTKDQEANLFTKLRSEIGFLTRVGEDPENPVPPVEEDEEEESGSGGLTDGDSGSSADQA